MEMTFAEIADVNRRERPRLCRCVDPVAIRSGRAACAIAAAVFKAVLPVRAGECCRQSEERWASAPNARGKGYLAHRFPREMLTKAAQLRKQRAKKG
jgi:hypothetical protein